MSHAHAQDIVFSNSKSLVGRIAKQLTGGDRYTHVGLVVNGYVYESDWPVSRKTPVSQYGKRGGTYDYYSLGLSTAEKQAVLRNASKELGKPYQLKNYFWPRSRNTTGTYCSPFVGRILDQSTRYRLAPHQYHDPQGIFDAVRPVFVRRTIK